MFCALLKAIYCYYIVQLLPASEMHYCWCLKRKISLQQLHLLLFFSSRFRSLKTYRSGLQTLVKCCCWKNAEYCKNKTCLVKMAHRTCWSRYELRTLKKNSFKPKNDTEMKSEIQNTFFIWGPHDYHSHLPDMKEKIQGIKSWFRRRRRW